MISFEILIIARDQSQNISKKKTCFGHSQKNVEYFWDPQETIYGPTIYGPLA